MSDSISQNLKADTIKHFAARFNCDESQTNRVKAKLNWILKEVTPRWVFTQEQVEIVRYACEVYEVGLSISASGFQKHSAYMVENSLLPGFNENEQALLTILVRNSRKKIKRQTLLNLTDTSDCQLIRLVCIFRLAILFTQKRQCEFARIEHLDVGDAGIDIKCNNDWLSHQGLLYADLQREADFLRAYGISLTLNKAQL